MKIILIIYLIWNSKLPNNFKFGTIKIKDNNSDLFYWLIESDRINYKDPLVIWLNGGPGASSSIGAFTENGPFKIKNNEKLEKNNYSWNKISNVLYIDQPIGTGFSKNNEKDILFDTKKTSEMFLEFLIKFYKKYPKFKNRKLFITGESYAGHFIPLYSKIIYEYKNNIFNLKGVLIGNGYTDINNQIYGYPKYGIKYNLISNFTYYLMKLSIPLIKILNYFNFYKISFYLLDNLFWFVNFKSKHNHYNIKLKDEYNYSSLNKFLNDIQIKKELNLENRTWIEENKKLRYKFREDFFTNSRQYLEFLLNENINVILYNGKDDYVCNYIGTRVYIKEIRKNIKNINKFKYIEIKNAGHMVPLDKPKVIFNIFKKFISI